MTSKDHFQPQAFMILWFYIAQNIAMRQNAKSCKAWSPGTECPGRLWSLLLWRYSRPTWTRSSAAFCRWPCLGRRVGLDDPQRSLPTPTILLFCDSVIITAKAVLGQPSLTGSDGIRIGPLDLEVWPSRERVYFLRTPFSKAPILPWQ